MRAARVITLGVVLVLGAMAGFVGAQSPDPQSLVGEWNGKWVRQGGMQTKGSQQSGTYKLTIKKVDGNVVQASIEAESVAMGPVDRDINGTLQGDRLTFAKTQLTVTGNQMRGTNTAGMFPVEINLTKK